MLIGTSVRMSLLRKKSVESRRSDSIDSAGYIEALVFGELDANTSDCFVYIYMHRRFWHKATRPFGMLQKRNYLIILESFCGLTLAIPGA